RCSNWSSPGSSSSRNRPTTRSPSRTSRSRTAAATEGRGRAVWGAIFYLEFLRTGRRLRLHVVRWLFAAWLLLALFLNAGAGKLPIFPLSLVLPQGPTSPPADVLLAQQF